MRGAKTGKGALICNNRVGILNKQISPDLSTQKAGSIYYLALGNNAPLLIYNAVII